MVPPDAPLPPDAAPRPPPTPVVGVFDCQAAALAGGDGVATRSTAVPPDGVSLPEHPDNPVFAWTGLAEREGVLYASSNDEIRRVVQAEDGATLHKVAGASQSAAGTTEFRGNVACGDARLRSLGDLAVLPDGSLVAVDEISNAVLRVSAPDDAETCFVHYVSGTSDEMAQRPGENQPPETVPANGPLVAKSYPNSGNADGDHRGARHYKPLLPAALDGDIYVLESDIEDARGRLLRRIVLDPETGRAQGVSTVARLSDVDTAYGLVAQDNRLYLLVVEGSNGAEGVIYEVDVAASAGNNLREVVRAGKEAWRADSSQAIRLSGLAACDGYLCVTGSFYVWRVHPQTGAIEVIAGLGNPGVRSSFSEFEAGYEHLGERAPTEMALPMAVSRATIRGFLASLVYEPGRDALWYAGETTQSAYLVRLSDCTTHE
ncbi:hypothetical protein [Haliangium ochraceum]|uniref:hypothetical protein n=1 Tax=Haliangium ochraceum TaxID=80816 RepID=UPI00019BB140|nr:hypothetical protein [Haliangium ochraceum]